MSPEHAFTAALAEHGLSTSSMLVGDGKLHRLHWTDHGDKHKRNGAYVLHGDGVPAGWASCWHCGIEVRWHAGGEADTDPAMRERIRAEQREREQQERLRRKEARRKAARMWARARPASPKHPYLIRKRVQPHGLRQLGDVLLLRVVGTDKRLYGLQRIWPDGTKKFTAGSDVTAHYYPFGELEGALLVAEGYATAASLHEITGAPVAVAFSKGNLRPVALELRDEVGSEVRIVIAADTDGVAEAEGAAEAAGGVVMAPKFANGSGGSDFNDLALERGPDVVLDIYRAALEQSDAPDVHVSESRTDSGPSTSTRILRTGRIRLTRRSTRARPVPSSSCSSHTPNPTRLRCSYIC